MDKIRWGILATGNIAHSFAKDFEYVKNGILTAVASRSMEKARSFARQYGIGRAYGNYEELYADQDIDAVYIATPHTLHFQNSSDALQAGKAVLCEKPLTVSAGECRKLMDVARDTDGYLMEAMWTYFLPPIVKTKEWIAEGRIGKVRYIRAEFGFRGHFPPEHRLYNPELAGGALLDIGIYPIALAWHIYGEMPEKITVFSRKYFTGVDSEETMIFEYDNSATANLIATVLYDLPNTAVIVGEKGYIVIPEFYIAREARLYVNEKQVDMFIDDRPTAGYNFETEAVGDDLLNGRKESGIVPLSTSLRLQEMMDMVREMF